MEMYIDYKESSR